MTQSDHLKLIKWRQFCISVSYGMTINKSYGQRLNKVDIYFASTMFSHVQLYVAFSCVTSPRGKKNSLSKLLFGNSFE
jgi:hypothetical protein